MKVAENNPLLPLRWAGKDWVLDSRRVLLLPSAKILFVADLHFGYYATLRSQGSYLPTYDREVVVPVLVDLVSTYNDYHWVVVGDLKHSHEHWDHLNRDERQELLKSLQPLQQVSQLTVLVGNHDKGVAEVLRECGVVAEVQQRYEGGGIAATHALPPDQTNCPLLLVGHVHPVFQPPRFPRMPVFAFGQHHILLPAFNPVAGGYPVWKVYADQWHLWGILPGHVQPLGPLEAWRNC